MIRLTALVPASVCAAALGRAWPDDLDGQVRCIDEGTRALALAWCCPPWPLDAEDAALRADSDRNLESLASYGPSTGADFDGDAVAAGLARVPGAPPVVGLVSGPLTWSSRVALDASPQDAVDAASDLASARVRALAGCGVERVVVVESADVGNLVDAELALEAHRPVLRTADHLHIDVLCVTTSSCAASTASLGYRTWASPGGCTDGLAFIPAAAFRSARALDRCVEDRRDALATATEVVTAPLGPDVDPSLVRHAAKLVAGPAPGGLR